MLKKQRIGILVNHSLYRRIPSGATKHENLSFYEEVCRQCGIVPCYFRLKDIDLANRRVWAYVLGEKGYTRRLVGLPRVIHNRAIHLTSRSKKRLSLLIESGICLFNPCNRYSKLKIHELLMSNPALRPHLPGTEQATPESVGRLMKQYGSLILKPDNSSIGRGVMLLEKKREQWHLTAAMKNGARRIYRFGDADPLPGLLRKRISQKRYVVQQRLPLALCQGRPFDLRVSVQKDGNGAWQVTGLVGKVAAKGKYVTNVAQGGSVVPLNRLIVEYPWLDEHSVRARVTQFSLLVARHLEQHLPGLADIGLDVGITAYGFPVFIECNCRDLRYSFKEGGMPEQWKATYANPVRYAKYLLDRLADRTSP
mgnify:CR=1 FL=1